MTMPYPKTLMSIEGVKLLLEKYIGIINSDSMERSAMSTCE
jgi:hypothetical protein